MKKKVIYLKQNLEMFNEACCICFKTILLNNLSNDDIIKFVSNFHFIGSKPYLFPGLDRSLSWSLPEVESNMYANIMTIGHSHLF